MVGKAIALRRRRAISLMAVGGAVAVASVAHADEWPNRTIKLIVPALPGGGGDIVGRLLAAPLSRLLGQAIIVDNRPGAAGNIATELLVRSPPDGYTLLLAYTGYAISPALFPNLQFDPLGDIAPITLVASSLTVLIVRGDSPYRSVQDLIGAARAEPGKLNVGYLQGSSQFLVTQELKHQTGINVADVPYKGNVQAMNDLLGGHIDFMFDTLAVAAPQIAAGTLRALAVTQATRSHLLPDVPTLAEAGVAGVVSRGWYGLVAPKATPSPIIERLHDAVAEALRDPQLYEKLAQIGSEPLSSTPAEFAAFLQKEIPHAAQVLRDAKAPS